MIKMTIDAKLMRKTIRHCGTELTTREVVDEFEEKYMGYASNTEEAAGLAILLSRMQHWREVAIFSSGGGLDQESEKKFLSQEAYPISVKVSEYLIRPQYEDRGVRGFLSFIFNPLCEFPLREETRHDYFEKELELRNRLKELYWDVVDSMKQEKSEGSNGTRRT